MNAPLVFYDAATGAPSTDMSKDLVSQWIAPPLGTNISLQPGWDGNVAGTWTVHGTNVETPTVVQAIGVDILPEDAYPTATQPTGTADTTTFSFVTTSGAHRLHFAHTSGGVGVTASGRALTSKG